LGAKPPITAREHEVVERHLTRLEVRLQLEPKRRGPFGFGGDVVLDAQQRLVAADDPEVGQFPGSGDNRPTRRPLKKRPTSCAAFDSDRPARPLPYLIVGAMMRLDCRRIALVREASSRYFVAAVERVQSESSET